MGGYGGLWGRPAPQLRDTRVRTRVSRFAEDGALYGEKRSNGWVRRFMGKARATTPRHTRAHAREPVRRRRRAVRGKAVQWVGTAVYGEGPRHNSETHACARA